MNHTALDSGSKIHSYFIYERDLFLYLPRHSIYITGRQLDRHTLTDGLTNKVTLVEESFTIRF